MVVVSSICTIEGCEGKHIARGLCWTHYQRQRRHGSPHVVLPQPGGKPKNRKCDVPDCGHKHYQHGLCAKHFQYFANRGQHKEASVDRVREIDLEKAGEILNRWGYTRVKSPIETSGRGESAS